MLRRCCLLSAIHRTIQGATIKDAKVISLLDNTVSKQLGTSSNSNSAAAVQYWTSPEMAKARHISILHNAKAKPVEVPVEVVGEKSSNINSSTVQLVNVAATNNPGAAPVHVDAGGRNISRLLQPVFEMVAAQRGYSSVRWFSKKECDLLHRVPRSDAKPVPVLNGPAAGGVTGKQQHHYYKDSVLKNNNNKSETEILFYNEEDVVPDAFLRENPDAAENLLPSTAANDSDIAAERGADVLRTGLGRALPALLQGRLSAIQRARRFESRKWFTVKQMHDAMMNPREGESIIEVVNEEGALFKVFNGDQLELGGKKQQQVQQQQQKTISSRSSAGANLSTLLRKYYPPRLASEEQEQRARESGNYLDGTGRCIWQSETRDFVNNAYKRRVARLEEEQRKKTEDLQQQVAVGKAKKSSASGKKQQKKHDLLANAKAAAAIKPPSRQFLTLFELNTLGCELVPDAVKVTVVSSGPLAMHTVLYNKDDCVQLDHDDFALVGDAA